MQIQSKKSPIPSQLPDEKIIFFIHRHWFIFLKLGLFLIFMILLPIFLYVIIKFQVPMAWQYFSGPLILIFGSYILLVITFGLIFWMNYYFDILIITNKRIIEIEQRDLFNRAIFSVEIIHVEDVSVEVKGVFPTVFGYGTLEVQTAGAVRNFIFHDISNPGIVGREISTLYNKLIKLGNHNKNNFQNHKPYPVDDELLGTKKIDKHNSIPEDKSNHKN